MTPTNMVVTIGISYFANHSSADCVVKYPFDIIIFNEMLQIAVSVRDY